MMPENGRDDDLIRAAVPLSAYWNAVVEGTAPSAGDLDLAPDLAATVRRLHATPSAPALSAARRDRIWRELMAEHGAGAHPAAPPPSLVESRNGHGHVVLARPIVPPPVRRGWLGAQLATAALLLVTLVSGYVAFLRPHFNAADVVNPGITIPVNSTLPVGVSDVVTVLATTIDAMPPGDGPFWGSVARTSLAPGTADTTGTAEDGGAGPLAFTVESGRITVEADGPLTVTRRIAAGSIRPESVSAGTMVTLESGDQLAAAPGVALRRRNDGSVPAGILEFRIVRGEALGTPGWLFVGDLPDIAFLTPPTVPVAVALQRLTLEPGGTVPVAGLPGLQLLYVDAGTVDLVGSGSGEPGAEPDYAIRAGNGTSHFGEDANRIVFANRGAAPAVLLVATLTATEAGSAAVARGAEVTLADAAVLLRGTVDAVPERAAWIGAERTILEAGAVWPLGRPEDKREGPMLFLVESGSLTIEADGPIFVTRSDSGVGVDMTPKIPILLNPGDRGFARTGVASSWRNDGSLPVSVLDAFVATLDTDRQRSDLAHDTLIDLWPVTPPNPPFTLEVRRLTLEADERLVPSRIVGLVGLYVEQGALDVIGTLGAESRPGSFTIPAGTSRVFAGKGYEGVPPGWTLLSTGSEPATILLLIVNDANPLEETPMG